SGTHPDVLEALLWGWMVTVHALLYRREAVLRSAGWDETLQGGQDADFLISVMLAGARADYLPGCHSIYRRYGAATISTADPRRWLDSSFAYRRKAEAQLSERGL